jgi:predicted nucleic acid-binding protein
MADDAVLVDTNVLLTATTPARALHREALTVLNEWPDRGVPLWVSGQILREYLVVATRPLDVNGLGLEVEAALANVAQFRGRVRLVDERVVVFEHLNRLVREIGCRGKQIHDANLVATALAHGAKRILTINVHDFRRFAAYVEIWDLAESG